MNCDFIEILAALVSQGWPRRKVIGLLWDPERPQGFLCFPGRPDLVLNRSGDGNVMALSFHGQVKGEEKMIGRGLSHRSCLALWLL